MYRWRKLSEEQRAEEAKRRRLSNLPMHSIKHRVCSTRVWLITATCYERRPYIGVSGQRMDDFAAGLTRLLETCCERVDAWVLLPNHYHILVCTDDVATLLKELGRHHGRTSRAWNLEENTVGRKVWFNALDRPVFTDRHHITALHYTLHNPVKHGYVNKWSEWRWSSAAEYIARVGRDEVERRWKEFPLLNFGKGWDD